jgi:ABC-type uncharacterized transport system involved in gliding motility auxiliary subunit
LGDESFLKNNIITSNLSKISVATSGFIKPLDKNTTFIPLITSSNMARDEYKAKFYYMDFNVLNNMNKMGNKKLTISAHISKDNVKTIFKNGFIEDNKTIKTGIKVSKERINVVIVSDTDMLSDSRWARSRTFFSQTVITPIADNARFVSNIIENLNGSDDFITLRGRGFKNREFTLLKDIKLKAEQKYLQKEKQLMLKLKELQLKLNQQMGKGQDKNKLSKQQKEIIKEANDEMLKVRASLREVQHELKKDIEFMENIFRWLNILGVSILVLLFGVFINKYFSKKRKDLLDI